MKHLYILVLAISGSAFATLTPSQQVQYETIIRNGNTNVVYELLLDGVPIEQSDADIPKMVESLLGGYPLLKDPGLSVNESKRLIREANCKSDYAASRCGSESIAPYVPNVPGVCKGKPRKCPSDQELRCDQGRWFCKFVRTG